MANARPAGKRFGAEAVINIAMKGLGGAKRGFEDVIKASKVLAIGVNDNIRLAEEAGVKFAGWRAVASDIKGIGYRTDELRKYMDKLLRSEIDLSQVPAEIQAALLALGADYRKVLTQVGRDLKGANTGLREHDASLDKMVKKADGLLEIEKAYKKVNDITKLLGTTTNALLKPFEGLIDLVPDLKTLFDAGNKSLDVFRETAKKLGLDIDQFLINKLFGAMKTIKIDPKFGGVIDQINQAKEKTLGDYSGPSWSDFMDQAPKLDLAPEIEVGKTTPKLDLVNPEAEAGKTIQSAAVAKTTEQASTSALSITEGIGAASSATEALSGVAAATESLGGAAALAHPVVLLVAAAVAAMAGALFLLGKGLSINVDVMEKFRTTGYRATGSIRDLTNNVFDLNIGLGVNREEAIASVDALARAGITVASLGERIKNSTGQVLNNHDAMLVLTRQNAMFAKATGASADTVAMFQKSMAVLNVDADRQNAILGQLTLDSKEYGLSGEDLNGVMSTLHRQSMLLKTVWDTTNYGSYTKSYMSMVGAARQLGLSLDVVARISDKILRGEKSAMALAAFGGNMKAMFGSDASAAMNATAAGAERILQVASKMQGAIKARFLEKFGGEEELMVLAKTQEALKNKTAAQRDAMAAEEEAKQALSQSYNESLGTITQSLQRIASPIMGLIAKAVGPLADALVAAFTAVQPFFEQFMVLIDPLIVAFKDMGSTFVDFISLNMKLLGPALLGIGKMLVSLATFAIRFVTAFMKTFMALEAFFSPVIGKISQLIGYLGLAASKVIDFFSMLYKGWSGWMDSFMKSDLIVWFLASVDNMFQNLLDSATALKDFLFGSSFLHIAEGVVEIMPSLGGLWDMFSMLLDPLSAARELWDALWSGPDTTTKEINIKQNLEDTADVNPIASREVAINDDSLQVLTKAFDPIIGVASPVYTVLLSEERDQRARQVNELIDGMDRVISLLAVIAGDEDPHGKKSADMLGRLVELAGKSDDRTHYPDRIPDGMGERSSRWWPGT